MKSTSLPTQNALWRKVTSVRTCILPSNSPKLLVVYDLPKTLKKKTKSNQLYVSFLSIAAYLLDI